MDVEGINKWMDLALGNPKKPQAVKRKVINKKEREEPFQREQANNKRDVSVLD